jgi:hypothetical protein
MDTANHFKHFSKDAGHRFPFSKESIVGHISAGQLLAAFAISLSQPV